MAEASQAAAPKKKKNLYYMHVCIGFIILILFAFILPNPEPITPLGMKVVGIFLAMVYWWSAIEALWPSIFGIFLLGCTGLAGSSNGVWMQAVGNYTVLLTLFAMILFGAVDEVGDTLYIAKWFLTRKLFKGRPWVFLAIFYACCFVLSTLVSPITGLIIMWPIALRLCEIMGITREDRLWRFFFVGMFLVMTLAQPFFPFMGAQLIPLSAFQSMTAQVGTPMSVPMLPYMCVDLIMTVIVMVIYLLAMRYIWKVDVIKMHDVDPAMVEETLPLPAMNGTQKAFLWMIPIYLAALLVPSFVKGNPVSDLLNYIGPLGVTAAFVSFFLIVHVDHKPMLNFKEVSYKQFNWGVFFMIAAAVYAATQLSSSDVGVSDWLVVVLTPVLGSQPEMAFVAIMFTIALIITNFANNAAMAVVLTPVVIQFSAQIGISPIPVEMGVVLMVFVAMLTPAASPHAGMMWGRRDIYSPKEILAIGFPMCLVTLVAYIFIGYPLCKMLVAAFGM